MEYYAPQQLPHIEYPDCSNYCACFNYLGPDQCDRQCPGKIQHSEEEAETDKEEDKNKHREGG